MYRRVVKRAFDVAVSLAAMPFLFLLVAVLGPIIRLYDKGPIFYRGLRLGQNGRPFIMYKLRSMVPGAQDVRNDDGSTYNAAEDPRVTRVGRILRKTSLDEAPQFLNVLKGDMSIVGPRPDLPDALQLYSEEHRQKLKTKPGITGYNQAYFRNSIDMDARLCNDVYYVKHLSFLLDLRILFKTAGSVLRGKNIYAASGPKSRPASGNVAERAASERKKP